MLIIEKMKITKIIIYCKTILTFTEKNNLAFLGSVSNNRK